MSPYCYAVIVADNGHGEPEEEVMRVRVPRGRDFSYVSPVSGFYHLFLVPEWASDWRTQAFYEERNNMGDWNALRHYSVDYGMKDGDYIA